MVCFLLGWNAPILPAARQRQVLCRVLAWLLTDKIFGNVNNNNSNKHPYFHPFKIKQYAFQASQFEKKAPGWRSFMYFLRTTTRSPVPCSLLQLSHSEADDALQNEPTSLQGICSTAAFLHSVCKSKEDGKVGSTCCLIPWISHGTMENVGSDSRTPFMLCVKAVIWIVQLKISHKLEQML